MKKNIFIVAVFFSLFTKETIAESDKTIKFDVYNANGYTYQVSENLLFIDGDTYDIYILSETEDDYRFFRPFLCGIYPYSFHPDKGHFASFMYGTDTPDFSAPEKVEEIELLEDYVNAILANTFRKFFILDESEYECPHEEKIAYLTEYYLPFLNKSQLRVLRNTIYAHYGYRFKSKDLQMLFSKCSSIEKKWYIPVDNFDESLISEPHKDFINLIKEFEYKK